MVDIHSHILPFVDDGSDSLEASLELIKDEISNGVDKILLTPHYKSGHYEKSIDELKSQFGSNLYCPFYLMGNLLNLSIFLFPAYGT